MHYFGEELKVQGQFAGNIIRCQERPLRSSNTVFPRTLGVALIMSLDL